MRDLIDRQLAYQKILTSSSKWLGGTSKNAAYRVIMRLPSVPLPK